MEGNENQELLELKVKFATLTQENNNLKSNFEQINAEKIALDICYVDEIRKSLGLRKTIVLIDQRCNDLEQANKKLTDDIKKLQDEKLDNKKPALPFDECDAA